MMWLVSTCVFMFAIELSFPHTQHILALRVEFPIVSTFSLISIIDLTSSSNCWTSVLTMIDIFLAKVKKINDGHKFICFDPTHVYQWVWVLVSPQELVEKGTGLEAAKITLCVSICAPSSQARVTSENFSSFLNPSKAEFKFSWKSFHFRQRLKENFLWGLISYLLIYLTILNNHPEMVR